MLHRKRKVQLRTLKWICCGSWSFSLLFNIQTATSRCGWSDMPSLSHPMLPAARAVMILRMVIAIVGITANWYAARSSARFVRAACPAIHTVRMQFVGFFICHQIFLPRCSWLDCFESAETSASLPMRIGWVLAGIAVAIVGTDISGAAAACV